MAVVQRLAQAAPQAFGCPGVMVAQFNGAAAGQTVFHLHFHVIPRWPDRAYGGHAQRKAEAEVLAANAQKIQQALENLPH